MQDPDFFDFVTEGGWGLLFPEDGNRTFECPFCGRVIEGGEEVEWVNKKQRAFKCPDCNAQLEVE